MSQKLQFRRSKHPTGKAKGYVIIETAPSPQSLQIRKTASSTGTSMSSRDQYREPVINLLSQDRYSGVRRRARGNDNYYDEYDLDSYSPARPSRIARDTMEPILIERLPNAPIYFESEHKRLRPRDRDEKASSGMPFGRAMRKLHKQLERAYLFYGGFKKDFENDIWAIKVYADDYVLDALWVMKLNGKSSQGRRGNTGSFGAHEDSDDENLSLERARTRFAVTSKKVVEALRTALHSHISGSSSQSKRSAAHRESIERLLGKVVTANDQIRSLLVAAMEGCENCDALLNELQMLRDLINPDGEKNKALYRDSGDEEDDGDERDDEDY